ncbi:MAG: paraslipin [Gammaproteobacteria bacterium]|nr:paraslipin [Gammaproteobacteria bacterium]
MFDVTTIILGGIGLVGVIFVIKGFHIVQQSEAIVIERLGSYNRTLDHGVNWIIPFIDKPRTMKVKRQARFSEELVVRDDAIIDLRETVLDFPSQHVITKDNVSIHVNGVLYYQIVDPRQAVYTVENMVLAIEVLAKTSLRNEIGKMELDKLFESRDEVNAALEKVMDEAGNKWGVKVNRVEIQDIAVPNEVEDAMRKQMVAERERRAAVTQAEGEKRAAILTAEGDKEAAIARAQGDKEAAILRAEGQRGAIERVLTVGEGRLAPLEVTGYLLALEYIEQLPHIAKEGERVFLPYEATALLGSLGPVGDVLGKNVDMLNASVRGGS